MTDREAVERLDLGAIEHLLSESLGLTRRPVAVAFRDEPPPGLERFSGSQPSGCSFWRLAAEGRAFATVAGDHANCAIGSYTHNIPLPAERAHELDETLGFMVSLGYVGMDEVPGIPRLPRTPGAVVYTPLGEAPLQPDVVLLAGRPGRLMLLFEAATRAGLPASSLLGRPTCMGLPAVLEGGVAFSFGCIGNRVYTDLGDDELYAIIAGADLGRVAAQLERIGAANSTLSDYHAARREQLTSPA